MGPHLNKLRRDGTYRNLNNVQAMGTRITINERSMINLGSNNYLGISLDGRIGKYSSSSRLISGNDTSYGTLEDMLASRRSDERALVYPTGYMAVLGMVTSLGASDCTILSDRLNHASIIDACRLSDGRTRIFDHNNMDDLRANIRDTDTDDIIIITEGIFSMDGDYSLLPEIVEIAEEYNAFILLDDAHGDFVVGNGHGTAAELSVEDSIYATVSSLSKGLGAFGGYVSGSNQVAEMQVNLSRPFIYTSALPAGLICNTVRRLGMNLDSHRQRLYSNVRRLGRGLEELGLCSGRQSHIIPIIIGDEERAVRFSEILYSLGIYARAIRYPTVPYGSARIRVSVTAALSDQDIQDILSGFESALRSA